MLNTFKSALFVSLFLAGIFIVSQSAQADFGSILIGFGMAFAAYAYFIKYKVSFGNPFVCLLILALVVRVYLLFVFPMLSDDIYRFYWDGLLIQSGINPYSFRPDEIMALEFLPNGIDQGLYMRLNSPEYYTIYPPVSQFMFYLASFAKSLTSFSFVLKIIFLVVELIGIRWLFLTLKAMDISRNNLFIYALNPLVIIEGIGNLHFELILISFLALFVYALISRTYIKSALFYGLSVLTKLTPAILGPLVLYYLHKRQLILRFLLLAGGLCIICFLPVFSSMNLLNLGDSLDLYFRKFEFNASIYYLLREIGAGISGYNLIAYIGPILAVLVLGLVLKLSSKLKEGDKHSFIKYALYSYTIYLLLATTVHPWYLLPLIYFSSFRNSFIILIWSFLIVLSYYTYSVEGRVEHPLFLFLEYAPIYAMLIYAYFTKGSHPLICI